MCRLHFCGTGMVGCMLWIANSLQRSTAFSHSIKSRANKISKTVDPALWTPAWYGHLVITNSFLCPWGKLLWIFSQFNPLNTDNGHLLFCPINSFYRKPTSLMRTLHCQLCAEETFPFLKVKRPLVDRIPMFPTLQCTGKDDFRHQFQTILASNLLCKERSWFLSYHINERFESFSKFTPRNDGFVIFRDVSFDDAFVLFIFLVLCSNKGVFFTFITWPAYHGHHVNTDTFIC